MTADRIAAWLTDLADLAELARLSLEIAPNLED